MDFFPFSLKEAVSGVDAASFFQLSCAKKQLSRLTIAAHHGIIPSSEKPRK
jgi:hypothetical protein